MVDGMKQNVDCAACFEHYVEMVDSDRGLAAARSRWVSALANLRQIL